MGFLSLDRCPLCKNKSIPSLSYSPNSLTMFLLESGEAWCIISTRYSYLQRSPSRLCYISEVSIHYSAKGGIGGGGGREGGFVSGIMFFFGVWVTLARIACKLTDGRNQRMLYEYVMDR